MKLSQLKTGDRLLSHGAGWLSRLIQWGQNSKYSHELDYVGKKSDILKVIDNMISKSNFYSLLYIFEAKQEILRLRGEFVFTESDWSKRSGRTGVHFFDEIELGKRGGYRDVFRYKKSTKAKRDSFVEFSVIQVGEMTKYDMLGLLWQTIVIGRKKFSQKETSWRFDDTKKMYCTELAQTLHNRSRSEFKIVPALTSPACVSELKELTKIGSLKT